MKCVIYARVSSKEQEETGYSLPAQEKFLQEYAAKKELKIARTFSVSESASGSKQRQVFTEMLRYVGNQGIKVLICEKADRLTRNFRDMVGIDDWLAEDDERQIHLVKDSLILHDNSRSQEKLNWGIRILFAKNYIDNLSEEVKKGLTEKLKQGWLPTKPPLGYRTIGEKGRKTHVVNAATAPIVRRMFELYASTSYSTKTLVEPMYEAGLRSTLGNKVPKSRIAKLLTDPFYIGKIRYRGEIHPGVHESLISEELYQKVQQLLHGNGAPRKRRHMPLFKALLRCEECECTITWELQKGHWYGHCTRYRNCTKRKFVRQEKIEAQILSYLDNITIKSSRLVEWIKKALKESHHDEIAFNASAREELNRHYQHAQNRLDRLYDDKIDGKIAEEMYQQKFRQYTEEKDGALTALKKHDLANTKYYELGSNILELAHRAKEIYLSEKRTIEERRTLLGIVFSNLKLNGDQLSPSYAPAFRILSNYAQSWNTSSEPLETQASKGKTDLSGPISSTLLPG